MKFFLSSFAFLPLFLLTLAPLVAQQPAVQTLTWEDHPEGIAFALILKTQTDGDVQKNILEVFMKNTSTTPKRYVGPDIYNLVVEIFYVDNDGKEVPLRDYSSPPGTPQPPPEIPPGGRLLRTVELTPAELALVIAHPVKCHISIVDESVNKSLFLESAPRQLVAKP